MVTKLELPKGDTATIINGIVSLRRNNNAFFTRILKDWLLVAKNYHVCGGSPLKFTPFDFKVYISKEELKQEEKTKATAKGKRLTLVERVALKRKTSFINFFEPKKDSELYTILNVMRHKHKLRTCPCCGEEGVPATLDHYLPKEYFPELSVVLENLTPMCSKCQTLKSSDYVPVNGEKRFLHPYYDCYDGFSFYIDIAPPFDAPSNFELKINCCSAMQKVISNHVDGINLVPRIESYCIEMHSDLLELFREKETTNDAKTTVGLFLSMQKKKGVNSWVAIYYQSVLNNKPFLAYLDSLLLLNDQ